MKEIILNLLYVILAGYVIYLLKNKLKSVTAVITFILNIIVKSLSVYFSKFINNRAMYNRYLASENALNDSLKKVAKEFGTSASEASRGLSALAALSPQALTDSQKAHRVFELAKNKMYEHYEKTGKYPNEIIISDVEYTAMINDMNSNMHGHFNCISPVSYQEKLFGMTIIRDSSTKELKVRFVDKTKERP